MNYKMHEFERPGKENTDEALEIAATFAKKHDVGRVVVASVTGFTASRALDIVGPERLVVVTHAAGFYEPNVDEFEEPVRQRLRAAGVPIVTAAHTFAGFARSVRRQFKTYLPEDIVAAAFRTVCEGFKVAYELACMTCDAGVVRSGERVLCVAGTAEGADTVVLVRAANSHAFFDTRVEAILAKPRTPTASS